MAVHETLQSVFDTIWNEFVVSDREQAKDDAGTCVYRGDRDADSNVRCAIGVCIPDEHYDPRIESRSPSYIKKDLPEMYEAVFNGVNPNDLSRLQEIHDTEFEDFEKKMREFAEYHKLTVPD